MCRSSAWTGPVVKTALAKFNIASNFSFVFLSNRKRRCERTLNGLISILVENRMVEQCFQQDSVVIVDFCVKPVFMEINGKSFIVL